MYNFAMMTLEDKTQLLHLLQSYKGFGMEYVRDFDYKHLKSTKNYTELPDSFDSLESFIEHCSLCELSKLCDSKSIGFGDPNSEIYIICEGLSYKNKNLMELIESILKKMGLSFQEIYITNIIKCNVEIAKENKLKYCEICKEYTLKQVAIKTPKTLITFGESWRYFLNLGYNDLICYGREYEYENSVLFPLYDLEFLYKNPSYQNDIEQHLKKIKRYLLRD